MKYKLRKITIGVLIGFGLLGCTPQQQALFNQLSPDQKAEVVKYLSSNPLCNEIDKKTGKPIRNVENCQTGWRIARSQGLSSQDFACVDGVVMGESGWYNVPNASGGSAYGIPQALPGKKMASHGADWYHNPVTQIRWMLDYMIDRYKSFCNAYKAKKAKGWY